MTANDAHERTPVTDTPRDSSQMTEAQTVLVQTAIQDRKRAIAKTLAYRTLMVVITVAVALVVTGSVGQALGIGLVANTVKTGTYYAHERLWDRIAWGVRKPPSP